MKHPPRAEIVVPLLVVVGAMLLAASELMVAFEFRPPGGEPLREATAADRHGYAMLILAVCAVVAVVTALATRSRAAAYAVGGFGILALLLFLIIDLPDAGRLGDLEDPVRGIVGTRAEPRAGFWLEAVGAVVLALAGVAFAALNYQR